MGILISRTYQNWTPDDIDAGEPSDSGFVCERERYTFRELLSLIRDNGFIHPSCYPPSGNVREWLTTEPETDWVSGETREESLHYHQDNPARNARYWRLAMIAAGIIRPAKV